MNTMISNQQTQIIMHQQQLIQASTHTPYNQYPACPPPAHYRFMPPPSGYTYHHNPWNAQQNRISPQNHYTNYHLQHPGMVQPHMYHQSRGPSPTTVAYNQQQEIQNTGGFSNVRPNISTNGPHSQKFPSRKGLKNDYKIHNQLPPRFRNNQAQKIPTLINIQVRKKTDKKICQSS